MEHFSAGLGRGRPKADGTPVSDADLAVEQALLDLLARERPPQTLNYDVPPEKLSELAHFDGSLIVYRTAGQVTATCDNEAANLLTVNLMDDIVQGTKTVEEARKEFGEQTAAWLMNREAPYTEGIRFAQPDESQTGYVDEPVMKAPTVHQTVEKVKDRLGIGDQR
ncbi:MAG: hypothetical protein AVDCRST_MAG67-2740 [uncultured Solirubrobacteraceae bacterium]|uniref:Uncharacterized protein n=1 Tax=uncultured Solirubrobacteraceae bacterium TaxID=1162706 RepID=A0A6J4T1Y5_9ACTN|nr:MAG: hypothetical protein AVDCRST_MAG67-2740 [uncultured Solirubrobacteraceae bacterium]